MKMRFIVTAGSTLT